MRKAGSDLDPGHPQFGLKQLLQRIGVDARRCRRLERCRADRGSAKLLLSETLRPAPTTDAWRALAESGGDDDRARA